jgi:hypothetical protein
MLALGDGYPTRIFVSAVAASESEAQRAIMAKANNVSRVRYLGILCTLLVQNDRETLQTIQDFDMRSKIAFQHEGSAKHTKVEYEEIFVQLIIPSCSSRPS